MEKSKRSADQINKQKKVGQSNQKSKKRGPLVKAAIEQRRRKGWSIKESKRGCQSMQQTQQKGNQEEQDVCGSKLQTTKKLTDQDRSVRREIHCSKQKSNKEDGKGLPIEESKRSLPIDATNPTKVPIEKSKRSID